MTIGLLNTFAGMGLSDCDVAPGKFMTIVFVNIFAGLGISDISSWPTGSTLACPEQVPDHRFLQALKADIARRTEEPPRVRPALHH